MKLSKYEKQKIETIVSETIINPKNFIISSAFSSSHFYWNCTKHTFSASLQALSKSLASGYRFPLLRSRVGHCIIDVFNLIVII